MTDTNDGGPALGLFSTSTKRGCPICEGIGPRTCARCRGKTRLCDWRRTRLGWAHGADAAIAESEADAMLRAREAGR